MNGNVYDMNILSDDTYDMHELDDVYNKNYNTSLYVCPICGSEYIVTDDDLPSNRIRCPVCGFYYYDFTF